VLTVSLFLACLESAAPGASQAPARTAEEIAEKRAREELRTSPRVLEVEYQRPEGVYVDAAFFGGRRTEGVAEALGAQLGALRESRPEIDGLQEVVYEGGSVKLRAGTVAVLDVPLPTPRTRDEALLATGFKPHLVQRWGELTHEFRVRHLQDFDRVVLHRSEPGGPLVDRVTAYRFPS
jgi:hypothetical protein